MPAKLLPCDLATKWRHGVEVQCHASPMLSAEAHNSGQLASDLEIIAEAHELTQAEARWLGNAVCGLVPGNRDRPVFMLARAIIASGSVRLYELTLPDRTPLARPEAALLDFVISVALRDAHGIDALEELITADTEAEQRQRALTQTLSRLLHQYRSEVIPETRYHNVFTAIRGFLGHHRPEDPTPRDGDAIALWSEVARRDFLTKYGTALAGLADYAEALRVAAMWQTPLELDADVAGAGREISEEAVLDDAAAGGAAAADHIATLAAAEVKLLLAQELDACREALRHLDTADRWPLSTLAGLAFGPVQNAIIQALRSRGDEDLDIAARLERADGYAQIRDRHQKLLRGIEDGLHLVHLASLDEDEMRSARSKLTYGTTQEDRENGTTPEPRPVDPRRARSGFARAVGGVAGHSRRASQALRCVGQAGRRDTGTSPR